jgi:hypothetical protein
VEHTQWAIAIGAASAPLPIGQEIQTGKRHRTGKGTRLDETIREKLLSRFAAYLDSVDYDESGEAAGACAMASRDHGPLVVTTAVVIRFVKTRAEIGGWNKAKE